MFTYILALTALHDGERVKKVSLSACSNCVLMNGTKKVGVGLCSNENESHEGQSTRGNHFLFPFAFPSNCSSIPLKLNEQILTLIRNEGQCDEGAT